MVSRKNPNGSETGSGRGSTTPPSRQNSGVAQVNCDGEGDNNDTDIENPPSPLPTSPQLRRQPSFMGANVDDFRNEGGNRHSAPRNLRFDQD